MEATTNGSVDIRRRAEDDLVRLAVLMAAGKGDSAESDWLRDNISCLESRLDPQDVQALRSLSSDLYMIEGDEIYDDNEPHYRTLQQLKTALHDRYEAHNWNGMLVLLRQEAPDLPDYLRALLRARAYEGLDSHAAAWAFYDYAAKIDHEQAAYKYFALYSQRLWDNEAAKKQAADLIGDENANAALRLFAGHIILQHHGTADPPKAVIRQLAADLIPALGSAAHDVNVPRDILLAGYGTLALCLEILGDYASAVDVLRLAASDGATPPMRHAYELLKLASQSVPSGIVIDPASLVSSIIDREQSFEDKIETTVMQQLVSHS